MKHIIIYILIFASLGAFSQAPGYRGKKISVKYNYNFMFSPSAAIKKNDDNYEGDFPNLFDSRHDFSLGITISNNKSLFFQFSYSDLVRSNTLNIYTRVFDGVSTYEVEHIADETFNLKQAGFGLGMRFFHEGWLAPLGVYSQLSAMFNINSAVGNASSQEIAINNLSLSYGVGVQRVLFDFLLLDFGFQTTFSFAYPFSSIKNSSYQHTAEYYDSENLTAVKNAIFFKDIIFLKLGIGILL